jgi:hypothetical protein
MLKWFRRVHFELHTTFINFKEYIIWVISLHTMIIMNPFPSSIGIVTLELVYNYKSPICYKTFGFNFFQFYIKQDYIKIIRLNPFS